MQDQPPFHTDPNAPDNQQQQHPQETPQNPPPQQQQVPPQQQSGQFSSVPPQQQQVPPVYPQNPPYQQQQQPGYNPYPQQQYQQPYGNYQQPQSSFFQAAPGYPPPPHKMDAPGSTAAFALSIIAIFGFFLYGIIGLGCGIFGFVLARKSMREYETSPGEYSVSSYNNSRAARICSLVAIILSSAAIVFWIINFIFFVDEISLWPWENL